MSEPSFEELVQGLQDESSKALVVPAPPSRIGRVYSPEAMVELIIQHPDWSHAALAEAFGRPPHWTSAVLASEAFQKALDGRRHEVADPSLSATMEERYAALAIQAVSVLQKKLESPAASDLLVIQAAGLGVKALGMGIKPPESAAPVQEQNASERLADKLLAAMDKRDADLEARRTVDVEAVEVKPSGQPAAD